MDPWIKDGGSCTREELSLRITDFICDGDYLLAYYTNRFLSLRFNSQTDLPPWEDLLELRVFNKDREIWAHRSTTGANFSWRIADDETLWEAAATQEDPFLKDAENHCIYTKQTLDINRKAESGFGATDKWGSRQLRTTVGGAYALPIGKDDGCVLVKHYLRYDVNGVATVADYRLVGFEPQKKG